MFEHIQMQKHVKGIYLSKDDNMLNESTLSHGFLDLRRLHILSFIAQEFPSVSDLPNSKYVRYHFCFISVVILYHLRGRWCLWHVHPRPVLHRNGDPHQFSRPVQSIQGRQCPASLLYQWSSTLQIHPADHWV